MATWSATKLWRIVREIKEETGYETRSTQLFRINDNPDRPREDRQNVDFVFIVEVGEKTGESDDEVLEVQWFDIDKLPAKKDVAFDHFEDVELFLDQSSEMIKDRG